MKYPVMLVAFCAAATPAAAQTSLTIYNDGRVLVRRTIALQVPKGSSSHHVELGAFDPATLFSRDSGIAILRAAYDGAVDEMSAARNAMVEGAGIAYLPPLSCAREVATGEVVRLLPAWVGPAVPVSLVYPSARLVPQRVVVVRDHLLEELVKVPWACTEEPRAKRINGKRRAAKARRA